jgi:hypothetical protein
MDNPTSHFLQRSPANVLFISIKSGIFTVGRNKPTFEGPYKTLVHLAGAYLQIGGKLPNFRKKRRPGGGSTSVN